jgi:thiol:disulfide interchange protein DsbC
VLGTRLTQIEQVVSGEIKMKPVTQSARLLAIAGFLLIGTVSAQPAQPNTDLAQIKANLQEKLSITVNDMSEAPIDGYYQVFTDRGLFYVSKDGKQLVHGKVYDIEKGVSDLTEVAYTGMRQKAMIDIKDSGLLFAAKDEKYQVSVFTDITCGYCRKMHAQIKEYNDMGITVRYYAYPRGGLNSKSSTDLSAIWCTKEPEAALTAAKVSGKVTGAACVTSPVASHYKLGVSFGVNSTPSIVFEDGTLTPGYVPPANLLATLQASK